MNDFEIRIKTYHCIYIFIIEEKQLRSVSVIVNTIKNIDFYIHREYHLRPTNISPVIFPCHVVRQKSSSAAVFNTVVEGYQL